MKKIILYGAGKRCKQLCKILNDTEIEVLCIIDSNPSKWDQIIYSQIVCKPDDLLKYHNFLYCITIADYNIQFQIRNMLNNKYNISEDNEVSYYQLMNIAMKNVLSQSELSDLYSNNISPNIVFDCGQGLGLGGIEAWTIEICKELKAQKMSNISILTDCNYYNISSNIESVVDHIDYNSNDLVDSTMCANIMKYFLVKSPCIFISSQFSYILSAACAVKSEYPNSIRIISVIHGGTDRIYREYEQYIDYLDCFVGVSTDIVYSMAQRTSKKVFLMTCPFYCPDILKRSYTTNPELPIKLAYAGRIEKEQKRFDLIIKLIDELENQNVNYVFDIVGKGSYTNELIQYINEKSLNGKVNYIGIIERDGISSFWSIHDIYINISDYEGHSISQMEAMANGAIPITTAVSGTMEDIIHGKNGYIVPVGEYKAIAWYIRYLSEHRENLESMGNLAHDIMYPKSSMKNHVEFWKELIRSVEWTLLNEQ